jgi:hypothetical protein
MILRWERKFRIWYALRDGAFCDNGYPPLAPESHIPILCRLDWRAHACLGTVSEGLGSSLKKLDASRHERTVISWRFAPMVYLTTVCFVTSGEHTRRKPVDGSQASMSQHRRLHLSRCIWGQQTRGHCPIMLRARIGGFSILYHTAD